MHINRLLDRLSPTSACLAVALSAVIFATGVSLGSRAASGSDSYGYVSQSQLWRHGTLVEPEPLARVATWANAAATLAPLGYRPAQRAFANVPTYPPGLPMLMATARIIGGPCAVYAIVPFSAALLVWLTYVLARRESDPLVATGAAILVATSPTLLFMMMWPMSDVPVSTFWLSAILATPKRPLLGAALTGVAILIRPNLVCLAVVPIGLALSQQTGGDRRAQLRTAVVLAAGLLPFIAGIALLNARLYGSPLEAGYGSLAGLYGFANVRRNLPLDASWLYESQGVYVFAFLLGIVLLFRRGSSSLLRWGAVFAGLVWCAYLPYHVYVDWWYLRFLLPALPFVYVLAVGGVATLSARLGPAGRALVTTVFVAAAAAHALAFAMEQGIAGIGEGEHRYVEVGYFVKDALPANALIFSTQHSGSIRYYSRRSTLRYDRLDGDWLDRTVERINDLQYHPYAVLDEGEERIFRVQFRGQQTLRLIDAGPIAELDTSTRVRIYDLRPSSSRSLETPQRIPHISRAHCSEPADH